GQRASSSSLWLAMSGFRGGRGHVFPHVLLPGFKGLDGSCHASGPGGSPGCGSFADDVVRGRGSRGGALSGTGSFRKSNRRKGRREGSTTGESIAGYFARCPRKIVFSTVHKLTN
ncbi:urease accessory protein, partial [Nannochloropsis gaditana CCMP526]|uniref:urease accessory protein n=1 Tax=Nannochloropsis gaditana (strain CCMP526) TaxID=1093141 RepID=UPI00029F64F2